MDFSYITGFSGSQLLYLKEDKHLFTRKCSKNGRTYWVCYDTIASAVNLVPGFCRARCTVIDATNECIRNETAHTCIGDHEVCVRDMESLAAMKDHCRYLANNFPNSAHKISIKDIFLAEMIK